MGRFDEAPSTGWPLHATALGTFDEHWHGVAAALKLRRGHYVPSYVHATRGTSTRKTNGSAQQLNK